MTAVYLKLGYVFGTDRLPAHTLITLLHSDIELAKFVINFADNVQPPAPLTHAGITLIRYTEHHTHNYTIIIMIVHNCFPHSMQCWVKSLLVQNSARLSVSVLFVLRRCVHVQKFARLLFSCWFTTLILLHGRYRRTSSVFLSLINKMVLSSFELHFVT